MGRISKRVTKKAGLPPETIIYTGEDWRTTTSATIINYDETEIIEEPVKDFDAGLRTNRERGVSWLSVNGVSNVSSIEKIGKIFNLNSLILEDIANTSQRPKLEDHEDYVFIVMNHFFSNSGEIRSGQISMILKSNTVITFQESEYPFLHMIKERLKSKKSRIRSMGSDYLIYSIMDSIVDGYFLEIEKIDDRIDIYESAVMENYTKETLAGIHKLKKDVMLMRRSIWPLREILVNIVHGEISFIDDSNVPFFRDVYDHVIQIVEIIDSFQDMISDMIEIYLSGLNIKMNETIKMLTIIATIFYPLTFLTGIYGMNFKFMPGLDWDLGFFMALGFMLFVVGIMIFYFKKKNLL